MKTQNYYLDFNHSNIYVKQQKIKSLIKELESEIKNYNHKLFYPITYFDLKRLLAVLKLAQKNNNFKIVAHEQHFFRFSS